MRRFASIEPRFFGASGRSRCGSLDLHGACQTADLSKACLRLQVPVPPRGYWAKLEAGKKVPRPKLPALQAGEAEEIVIWVPKAAP